MLSRNLPTHADQVAQFDGGTEEFPWGTGPIDEQMGVRDDVDIDATTPDETTTLRMKSPTATHDGPALDAQDLNHTCRHAPRPVHQC
eukprot:SAG31_NODE_30993_length_373_cov_1.529197_1_plen_86_part_10